MGRCLFAAAACLALASPASAKDNSSYVGIAIGTSWPNSHDIQEAIDYNDPATADVSFHSIARLDAGTGLDTNLIAGYDFGTFRLEGELGHRHNAAHSRITNPIYANDVRPTNLSDWSGMINGWVDLGGNGSFGGGLGGGIGYANVREYNLTRGSFAWQLMAQAYYSVSDHVDVGLRYRYMHSGRTGVGESTTLSICPGGPCVPIGVMKVRDNSDFASHSVLLSLVYNLSARSAR